MEPAVFNKKENWSYKRYKKNLRYSVGKRVGEDRYIFSYKTHVATVLHDGVKQILAIMPGYAHYSRTTTKHLNYVSAWYGVSKDEKYFENLENMRKNVELVEKL